MCINHLYRNIQIIYLCYKIDGNKFLFLLSLLIRANSIQIYDQMTFHEKNQSDSVHLKKIFFDGGNFHHFQALLGIP